MPEQKRIRYAGISMMVRTSLSDPRYDQQMRADLKNPEMGFWIKTNKTIQNYEYFLSSKMFSIIKNAEYERQDKH